MSFKTVLLQQVINGFSHTGLLHRLNDDDIELLITVAKYAEKRVEGLISDDNTMPLPPVRESATPAGIAASFANIAAPAPAPAVPTQSDAIAPSINPAAIHDAAQTLSFDRGPEPQPVSETLDTRAPIDNATDGGFDPTDPPPDYTKLPPIKGGSNGPAA